MAVLRLCPANTIIGIMAMTLTTSCTTTITPGTVEMLRQRDTGVCNKRQKINKNGNSIKNLIQKGSDTDLPSATKSSESNVKKSNGSAAGKKSSTKSAENKAPNLGLTPRSNTVNSQHPKASNWARNRHRSIEKWTAALCGMNRGNIHFPRVHPFKPFFWFRVQQQQNNFLLQNSLN